MKRWLDAHEVITCFLRQRRFSACCVTAAYETKRWYLNEGGRREQPKMMVPQLRHVSSPAAVSTGKLSLLRKVRASAASRFPIQCETLSLLRKVMAVRKAAV